MTSTMLVCFQLTQWFYTLTPLHIHMSVYYVRNRWYVKRLSVIRTHSINTKHWWARVNASYMINSKFKIENFCREIFLFDISNNFTEIQNENCKNSIKKELKVLVYAIMFQSSSIEQCKHGLMTLTHSICECGYVRIFSTSPGYRSN